MSDQYVVSARKYRPQTFDTVIGQEHITTTLKNSIRKNQLAHAFLFCGPRGVGKTTCARILAKTLNCENPTAELEACGTCSNCQSFQNNASFNIFELDAASRNSVNDIRELNDQVRVSPPQGKYKVYIIDEVHMLSTAAFNAFLKTLEEPPSYAIFILATTEKHKILPTILSRCQVFDFKRITTNDTVAHLKSIIHTENVHAEDEALHIIAQMSEGCMRDALSILDKISSFTDGNITYQDTMTHLNQLDANFYFSITDWFLCSDVSSVLLKFDEIIDKGFEGDILLNGLGEHLRNLLLCKDARMVKLLDIPQNHKALFFEKAGQVPVNFILSALNIINESLLEYKNAINKRLHTELCLIRLCYILQATQANDSTIEKKKSEPLNKSIENISPSTTPQNNADLNKTDNGFNKPNTNENKSLPSNKVQITEVKPTESAQPKTQANTHALDQINSETSNSVTNNKVRRISRNIISSTEITNPKNIVTSITLEHVTKIFEQYTNTLKEQEKSVLYNVFNAAKIELYEENKINIIANTSLNEAYIKSEKNEFQDFINKETGIVLSISTSHNEDPAVEPKSKSLSKTEILEEMSKKLPEILILKETLNMTIDY